MTLEAHPPRVRACLFDMDGLLLDTEDLITTCINTILHKYGKPNLPWSVKARIQGRTAEESDVILQQWAQLPVTMDEYRKELSGIQHSVFPTARPLPGVEKLLDDLQQRGDEKVKLALATSSSRPKFLRKTSRCTHLFDCFPPNCRVLGDDPRVAHHKPAPHIYLCALQCVNDRLSQTAGTPGDGDLHAGQCLVFEDSIQGVEAGRRAGMQVIWCPHPKLLKELFEGSVEDVRKHFRSVFGLHDSTPIQSSDARTLAERIAEATNGWVTLVETLESFDYEKYGL